MFPIFGLSNKEGKPGLIGISGKAGSGKDTLGKYICDRYFKNIGELIDVAVMRDKNSGRSRGFAFVTFIVYPTILEVEEI